MEVAVVTMASGNPMGQQAYEESILRHLMDRTGSVRVHRVRVRSMRSDLPSEARIPYGLLARLPLWAQIVVGTAAYGHHDLVHRCDLRLPPVLRPEVLTVHDTGWLHFEDEGTPLIHHVRAAQRARFVIVPSEFAGSEVVAGLGIATDRLRVVHNGFDPRFSQASPLSASELGSRGLPPRFVLHSGGCSRRKNLPLLAAAWRRVADMDPGLSIVLCGPPDQRRSAAFAGLPRVHLPGRVPSDDHARLTATAVCVVVPSLYEGFGLPALEAMAAGTPVVAAAGSSLEEVCGDGALVVLPNETEIVEAVLSLAGDAGLRDQLSRRGRHRARMFSWEESARQHEEIYLHALS